MWFSASELAGMPGLPGSHRGINKKATKENWQGRERQKLGGGKEYHISFLPIETQQYLAQTQKQLPDPVIAPPAEVQNFALQPDAELPELELLEEESAANTQYPISIAQYLTDSEITNADLHAELRLFSNPRPNTVPIVGGNGKGNSDRARANLEIQLAFDKFLDECCTPAAINKTDCEYRFCEFYKRRELTFPKDIDVYKFFPTISRSKLCRDRQLLKTEGTQRLGGNHGNRKGQTIIDKNPEMQAVILGLILKPSVNIHMELVKRFADNAPSLPTVTRWVKGWKDRHLQEWALLNSTNKFNSKFRAAYGDADAGISQVNQRWEIDATKGDIFLADGKRYCLLRVIDVYSRRIKTYVSPSVSSVAYMRGLLYQAFLDWGIPDELRTDNGKAEISGLMCMALADLGIKHHICTVRSPWEKPFVERSLNTRGMLGQLPGFCGANVAEGQRIRERGQEDIELRLTAEQLQDEIEKWTIAYENRMHRGFDGTERQGLTPIQAWANSPGVVRRVSSDREKQALSLLLAEVPHGGGIRTVQKKGIEIGRGTWFADSEGEWQAWIGYQVLVKYSPCGDAGIVHAFELSEGGGLGRFLFTATNAEMLGEDRAAKAQKAKDRQKSVKASVRELKQLARAVAAEQMEDIPTAEILAFSLPKQDFEAAALSAATAAIEALIPQAPKPPTADELAAQVEQRKNLERLEQKRTMQIVEDPGDRYRRLWTLRKQGGDLTEDELSFVKRFESMSQGRMMKQVLESRG